MPIDNDVMHQGKTIAQWEKDFNGEFTKAQLEKMIRGGCDLQKLLVLGLDEAEATPSKKQAKDIDDKQLFKGEEFFFNEASAEDIDVALAESATDSIVTTKDFVSQMKRNLANDTDKIMFRVNKKPYEVFDMHDKSGTFVIDLVPQVANSLNEDIIEDPDIDTAADLIDTVNDATNGNVNSAIVKIEDDTGREYNITSISGYKGNLYIGIAMKNAIRESNSMYKNYRDKVISFIEDGLLSWEEVGNECLQRMSVDEIEDMVKNCGWDDDHASSLHEGQKLNDVDESVKNGDIMSVADLKRIGEEKYPRNKDGWMYDSIVGVINGKIVDFAEVEHFKPDYPGEGTFFLLDGSSASRKEFEKTRNAMAMNESEVPNYVVKIDIDGIAKGWTINAKNEEDAKNKALAQAKKREKDASNIKVIDVIQVEKLDMNEGYNWRNGGYGGTGRSYRSFGELGAPRGKAISWFEVAELDPKARGKMKEWRVGPCNFPFKDLLYPERKYKVGTTVLRSKFLKAGDESGVKYIAIPSYLEAIWNNDEAAIELLNSLGIPLDLTFGYNRGEDFSGTYTT